MRALADSYCRQYGASPEEYLLERERREKTLGLVEQILPLLTPYELSIFEMYVLEGRTFEDIGKTLGKDESTIRRKLDNIHKFIAKRVHDKETLTELKEYILDNPSLKEASTPNNALGWMCERLPKHCVGYKWGITRGRKEWKPVYKCMMHTYTDAICTLCGVRCTNPINKERINATNSKTF